MPFTTPDEELLQADSAPVSRSAGGGAGFSVPESERLNEHGQTAHESAQSYLQALNAGQTTLPATPEEHYQSAKAFFDQHPLAGVGSGIADAVTHPGATLGKVGETMRGLLARGYEGAKNVVSEAAGAMVPSTAAGATGLAEDVGAFNPVNDAETSGGAITATPKLLASAAIGGAKGLYGLGKLGAEAAGKVYDLNPGGAFMEEGGVPIAQQQETRVTPEDEGRARAARDFALRSFNANGEAPAMQAVDSVTPLPAVSAAAENIVPLFVPVGPELAGAGLASRGAEVVGNMIPRAAADVVADVGQGLKWVGSPKIAGAAGALSGIKLGAELGGHGGAYVAGEVGRELGTALGGKLVQGGQAMENAAKALAQSPGVAAGVERIVRPVLATGEAAGAGAAMGYAGAPSGGEGEGALRGLSLGLAAAPLAGTAAARRSATGEAPAAVLPAGPVPGRALASLPLVTPARAEAFGALTRGLDGLGPADANVRLNAAEAAGVRDTAGDLLLFARTGQKRANTALAGLR